MNPTMLALHASATQIQVAVGSQASQGKAYYDAVRLLDGGQETSFTYKTGGNYVEKVTDPLGNATTLATDNRGNVTGVTDPKGNTSTITYDAFDRVDTATTPIGLLSIYGYDQNGNPTSVVNKDNATDAVINSSSATFNELGLVKTVTDQNGKVTSFEYDANGNLQQVKMPNGKAVVYEYDAVDRHSKVHYGDPNAIKWSYQYDKDGNTTRVIKDGGQPTTYDYDDLNRLTRIGYPTIGSSTPSTQYSYNLSGQVTEVKSSFVPIGVRYEYDSAGVNVYVAGPNNHETAYMYDEAGRLKKIAQISAGAVVTVAYREYDAIRRIISLRTENKSGVTKSRRTPYYRRNCRCY